MAAGGRQWAWLTQFSWLFSLRSFRCPQDDSKECGSESSSLSSARVQRQWLFVDTTPKLSAAAHKALLVEYLKTNFHTPLLFIKAIACSDCCVK